MRNEGQSGADRQERTGDRSGQAPASGPYAGRRPNDRQRGPQRRGQQPYGQDRRQFDRSRPRPERSSGPPKQPGKLRVLVIGGGGREHALAWKIAQSPKVERVFVIPGSPGMSQIAHCIDLRVEDHGEIIAFVQRNQVDLTVVGPEIPLANGIVDDFAKRGLKIFGPTRKAAELEWSKSFAKEFMRRHHIPTASFRVFSEPIPAMTFCRTTSYPLVIKADGLSAGKGVVVAGDYDEAVRAIEDMLIRKIYGKAGRKIIVESFLEGQELSVMAFCDGERVWPMLTAQDHKRIGEGDTGPNTGGMGAYSPAPFADSALMSEIQVRILEPCVAGMALEDRPYKGVLYAGLMLTKEGPKVLEFNCRFGDPETQVVLPMLESDLVEVLMQIVTTAPRMTSRKERPDSPRAPRPNGEARGESEQGAGPRYLRDLPSDYDPDTEPEDAPKAPLSVRWKSGYAVTVTLASKGYPGKPETGKRIQGIDSPPSEHAVIFHAGVKRAQDGWQTNGGRVMNVTATGDTLESALKNAYTIVDRIRFQGMQYRRDIGKRALDFLTSHAPAPGM